MIGPGVKINEDFNAVNASSTLIDQKSQLKMRQIRMFRLTFHHRQQRSNEWVSML